MTAWKPPPWVMPLLELAKREGLQMDDSQQMADFAQRIARFVAARSAALGRPDPDGLAPWQRQAADEFTAGYLSLAGRLAARASAEAE